jgi:hypothetical protein
MKVEVDYQDLKLLMVAAVAWGSTMIESGDSDARQKGLEYKQAAYRVRESIRTSKLPALGPLNHR